MDKFLKFVDSQGGPIALAIELGVAIWILISFTRCALQG